MKISNLNNLIDFHLKNGAKVFLLTDQNTSRCCKPVLGAYVDFSEIKEITIPAGEENKTIETCQHVWQVLQENGATRSSLLINLGGGVVTDLGGFCASTFKRGINFVNIPTSLLAMVDASTGGKTGVDFHGLKNQIGTFAFAEEVIIDSIFLKTLPERELRSGTAEMIKHGLIQNAAHLNAVNSYFRKNEGNLDKLILDSVAIKQNVVDQDPTEKGLRKILNFGHTIGHAIETWFLENSDTPMLHGEAIAIGMICEAHLSVEMGLLEPEKLEEILKIIQGIFPHETIPQQAIEPIMELMQHDKKNSQGQISFTLLDNIGSAVYDQYPDAQHIKSSLDFYQSQMPLA
jgi:3-dehydroquinate synthase